MGIGVQPERFVMLFPGMASQWCGGTDSGMGSTRIRFNREAGCLPKPWNQHPWINMRCINPKEMILLNLAVHVMAQRVPPAAGHGKESAQTLQEQKRSTADREIPITREKLQAKGQVRRPKNGAGVKGPGTEDPDHSIDSSQGKTSISHTRIRRIFSQFTSPGSPNISVTFYKPVAEAVIEYPGIQLEHKNIIPGGEHLIEVRSHQQLIVSSNGSQIPIGNRTRADAQLGGGCDGEVLQKACRRLTGFV